MTRHILVTGATGKTGKRLVARLSTRGQHYRAGSRQPADDDAVEFDWNNADTWRGALLGVGAVYLVAPARATDPADTMIKFIESALTAHPTRFVLLSSSLLEAGGPAMGSVHKFLNDNADDWAVLRPSWFMQNFSEGTHQEDIRDAGKIYSATNGGRVAFIDAEDIADVAYEVLAADEPLNADLVLTGPGALSYDEVAHCISQRIGRAITHVSVPVEELVATHQRRGLSKLHAQTLALMDLAIAGGAENRVTDSVERITGQAPRRFHDFVTRSFMNRAE